MATFALVNAKIGVGTSTGLDEQRTGLPVPGEVPPAASFAQSLVPMVLADDQRRYVAANAAACLLLRLPEEEILRLTVDDLTPQESRPLIGSLWEEFIREGTQHGTYDLLAPDGGRVRVEYSARTNVAPGQHLSILMFPPGASDHRPSELSNSVLTAREREVLGRVAMGQSSGEIADALVVARSTVESHVRHCLDKLGARNRAHAIAVALERGEITLELQRTR